MLNIDLAPLVLMVEILLSVFVIWEKVISANLRLIVYGFYMEL